MSSDALVCQIRCDETIHALAARRRAFRPLRRMTPSPDAVSHWTVDEEPYALIEVLVMGKTGYGKSTLFNVLAGVEAFETSDVEACTREMQSAEFRFDGPSRCALSFTDLPGIGESAARDEEYLELYARALKRAHMIVYALRADQRDYQVDEEVFQTLQLLSRLRGFTLALTCIDKISPTNRSSPFRMTPEQGANLGHKVSEVRGLFNLARDQVVPVSALEGIGMDALAGRIVHVLSAYMEGGSQVRAAVRA
ncbi:GTPase [Caulobacter sp. CCNWLY153]|jgi:small GTP-binding protein|nr:GTPase [Caulobacter radicis]